MTVPRLLTVVILAALVVAGLPTEARSQGIPAGMAEIEGGEFEMGMPAKVLKNYKPWKNNERIQEFLALETPEHDVTLGAYFIDKYEVTNAQYLAFLDDAHKTTRQVAGGLNTLMKIAVEIHGSEADEEWWKAIYHLNWKTLNPELVEVTEKEKYPGGLPDTSWATKELKEDLRLIVYSLPMPKHWLDHGTIPPGLEDHPVRYMSWEHANQYARWAGKHIPTEAEWEHAARGPENTVYPWGEEWRKFAWDRKEVRLNWALLPANHPARDKNPAILTTPVGKFEDGKSAFGVYDMLGNVWEWTDDTFGKYPGSEVEDETWWAEARAVRGGAYNSTDLLLRGTFRTGGDGRDLIFRPKDSVESFGFRCARWPVPGADRAYQAWRGMDEAKLIPEDDRKVVEFSRTDGIGVEATRYDIRENHVYVVGRSRAIAVLPRTKLPVSLIRDLNEKSQKSRGGLGVVVGILTTDLDLQVFTKPAPEPGGTVKKDAPEVEGVAPAGDYILAYHDGRLQLLKGDIMGFTPAGYICSKAAAGQIEVALLAKEDRNTSWTVTGLDEAHLKFSVNRRARGRDRFVFHAVFKTAEKSVLNVQWDIHK